MENAGLYGVSLLTPDYIFINEQLQQGAFLEDSWKDALTER